MARAGLSPSLSLLAARFDCDAFDRFQGRTSYRSSVSQRGNCASSYSSHTNSCQKLVQGKFSACTPILRGVLLRSMGHWGSFAEG